MEAILAKAKKASARANPNRPMNSMTPRRPGGVVFISIIAAEIRSFSAFVALALLRLIGLYTNLFSSIAGYHY